MVEQNFRIRLSATAMCGVGKSKLLMQRLFVISSQMLINKDDVIPNLSENKTPAED